VTCITWRAGACGCVEVVSEARGRDRVRAVHDRLFVWYWRAPGVRGVLLPRGCAPAGASTRAAASSASRSSSARETPTRARITRPADRSATRRARTKNWGQVLQSHIMAMQGATPIISRPGLTLGMLSFLCLNPVRSNRSWLRPCRWPTRLMLYVTWLRAAPSAGSSSQSDRL